MGITYWLVPHLAGRVLWSRAVALVQVWLWFGGMLIFSPTLHELGLRGMPRRTDIGHVSYMQPQWKTLLPLVGIGGSILFVSAALYFLNMVLTATVSRRAPQAAPDFAEAVSGPDHAPAFVDRWPRRRKARVKFELAALRPFLEYLRAEAAVPIPPRIDASPADDLNRRYVNYLRNERGLTENSVRVYSPLIRDFLTEQVARTGYASPGALDAMTVRDFLLDRVRNRSSEYTRLLATALRSLL